MVIWLSLNKVKLRATDGDALSHISTGVKLVFTFTVSGSGTGSVVIDDDGAGAGQGRNYKLWIV